MSKNFTDELVTLIIGDNNSKFDGKIFSESNCNSHELSLINIKNKLFNYDYNLPISINNGLADNIYSLLIEGHIVFLNVSCNDIRLGYLYVPINITKKQKDSLYRMYDSLKEFDLINYTIDNTQTNYFIKLNKNNKILKNRKV